MKAKNLEKHIETTFIKTYKELNLPENISLGIAFSGGPDSSLLLYLFNKLKDYLKIKNIKVLYFNHLLRGKESQKEEEFVKKVVKNYNLELIIGYPKSEPPTKNIEAWARKERYGFLEKIKKEKNLDFIALGHNLSDLVETILLNFIKGCFFEGLKGFLPKRYFFIRPLIKISKPDIESYLIKKNIPYFIDSSNLSTKFERNYLRHEIIPLLKKLNPSLEKTLFNFAQNMWDFLEFYNPFLENFFKDKVCKNIRDIRNLNYLNRKIFLTLPRHLQKELIIFFLKKKYNISISSKELFEILNIIKKYKNFKRSFGNITLKIENNKISFILNKVN